MKGAWLSGSFHRSGGPRLAVSRVGRCIEFWRNAAVRAIPTIAKPSQRGKIGPVVSAPFGGVARVVAAGSLRAVETVRR